MQNPKRVQILSHFKEVFGVDKDEFAAMPPWKRINVKKAKGLF